jgi:hypothetical protein
MDRNLMGNDAATLRHLCGDLNNPALTGAVVPPEEKITQISAPMPLAAEMRSPTSPLAAAVKRGLDHAEKVLRENTLSGPPIPMLTPHQKREAKQAVAPIAPQPITANSSHSPSKRILFTGHPSVGKSWLAAQIKARVFEFSDPIYALAGVAFGTVADVKLLDDFVQDITAWGEGYISPEYPLTAMRAMFLDSIREAGADGEELMGMPLHIFGTPGFWAKSLLARVALYENNKPNATVVVTGIQSPEQFKLLQSQGFRPYHVSCQNTTRAKRGATTSDFNRVAAMIEQDITNKLSRQPSGGKLWCVWNDQENNSPSNRLLSLQEFLAAYQ